MIKKKNDQIVESVAPKNQDEHLWKQFVQTVSAHIDPVLASMLYATELVQFDRARQTIEVVTLKKFVLFQDLFLEQKHVYQEYLNRLFGFQATLIVQFTKVDAPMAVQPRIVSTVSDNIAPVVMPPKPKQAPVSSPAPTAYYGRKSTPQQSAPVALNERSIDVSDTKKWKITHSLLQQFGGTVREIIKDTHEFDA